MKAVIVLPSDLSSRDIEAWARFNISIPGLTTAFLSYPYVLAAEKAFRNVRICRVEDNGEPVLFFPFQYRSFIHRYFGIGQCVAGSLSDYFGIVAKEGARIDSRALLSLSKLTALLFTHLDESQLAFGLRGQSPECGHLVEFPEGGEAFLRAKRLSDRKLIADTERRERRLEQDLGPIRFELQSQNLRGELEKLVAAKREQYARTKVADPLRTKSSSRFLDLLLTSTHALCSGLMSTLYVGDTWVASHFGLQCDKTLHHWFPAYNPILRAYGPGRLLLKKMIHHAHERGITRIDFGAGDAPSKRDFSTTTHDYYRGFWSVNGLPSLSYRLSLSLLWRYGKIKGRICAGEETHGAD